MQYHRLCHYMQLPTILFLLGLAACWSPPRVMLKGVAPLDPPADSSEQSREVPVRLYLLRSAEPFLLVSSLGSFWDTSSDKIPDCLKDCAVAPPRQVRIAVGTPRDAGDFVDANGDAAFTKDVKYVGIVANFQSEVPVEHWRLVVPARELFDRMIQAEGRSLKIVPKEQRRNPY